MNSQSLTTLLNFFPLNGVFATLTLKMQAATTRDPRDTISGVFPALWYGDGQARPRRFFPLGSAQWYLLLFQALDGPLPFICADAVFNAVNPKGKEKEEEGETKGKGEKEKVQGKEKEQRKQTLALQEELINDHALLSGRTFTYLSLRTIFYSAFCPASHPFSIIRTYYLIATDLPAEANGRSCFSLTSDNGLYHRSLFSHWITGVSEIWVGHIFTRIFSWAEKRFSFLLPFEAKAIQPANGKRLLGRSCQESRMSGMGKLVCNGAMKAVASFVTRTALFPLYTIRARLESEWLHPDIRYEGFFDCLTHILQEEGVSGLYRGISSHLTSFGLHAIYISLLWGVARGFIKADLWEDTDDDTEEEEEEEDDYGFHKNGKRLW